MVKKIGIVLASLISVLFTYVAMKPADYFIEREISIHAPAEKVFPFVVSMKQTDQWMPWKESDPNVKMSFQGPDAGVGSIASWESQGSMGVGKSEVIEVVPNQKVVTRITYAKPMEFTQLSEFILTSHGESTIMAWTVAGKSPFIARLMCTISLMDMDKYIGGEFEKGLNKLKTMVESAP